MSGFCPIRVDTLHPVGEDVIPHKLFVATWRFIGKVINLVYTQGTYSPIKREGCSITL